MKWSERPAGCSQSSTPPQQVVVFLRIASFLHQHQATPPTSLCWKNQKQKARRHLLQPNSSGNLTTRHCRLRRETSWRVNLNGRLFATDKFARRQQCCPQDLWNYTPLDNSNLGQAQESLETSGSTLYSAQVAPQCLKLPKTPHSRSKVSHAQGL